MKKPLTEIEKEAIKLVKLYKHRRDCGDFVPIAHTDVAFQMNTLESAVDWAKNDQRISRLLKHRKVNKTGYWKRKFEKEHS